MTAVGLDLKHPKAKRPFLLILYQILTTDRKLLVITLKRHGADVSVHNNRMESEYVKLRQNCLAQSLLFSCKCIMQIRMTIHTTCQCLYYKCRWLCKRFFLNEDDVWIKSKFNLKVQTQRRLHEVKQSKSVPQRKQKVSPFQRLNGQWFKE